MRNSVREISVQYPLLKTGLILDINNLYFAIQNRYGKRRLQIGEYLKYLESQGHTLTFKIAYSRQKLEDAPAFVEILRSLGFEIHFGSQHWGTAMVLRAVDITPYVDCVVLGTNFQDAFRVFKWVRDHGKLTKCFATNIPAMFKEIAECVEIPSEILSDPPPATKPMELLTNSSGDGVQYNG
jgi:hypothetical protein